MGKVVETLERRVLFSALSEIYAIPYDDMNGSVDESNHHIFVTDGRDRLISVDTSAAETSASVISPSGLHVVGSAMTTASRYYFFVSESDGVFGTPAYTGVYESDGTLAGTKALIMPEGMGTLYGGEVLSGRLAVRTSGPGSSILFLDSATGVFHALADVSASTTFFQMNHQTYFVIENALFRIRFHEDGSCSPELVRSSFPQIYNPIEVGSHLFCRFSNPSDGSDTFAFIDESTLTISPIDVGIGTRFTYIAWKGAVWSIGSRITRFDASTASASDVHTFDDAVVMDQYTEVVATSKRLIFNVQDKAWSSDGTAAGTHPIKALSAESVFAPESRGGIISFSGYDRAHGSEVWITNGTDSGTRIIDLNPGPADGVVGVPVLYADELYFLGERGSASGLFRTGYKSLPPVAAVIDDLNVREGSSLKLDASDSSDPEGDSLFYEWDLNGDGKFTDVRSEKPVLTVSWTELNKLGIKDGPSTFNAAFRVSDALNTTASTPVLLRVRDAAPTINASAPAESLRNTNIPVTLTYSDPGADTRQSLTADWGDGNSSTYKGSPKQITHRYDAIGGFTIRITVEDEDGSHAIAAFGVKVSKSLKQLTKLASRPGLISAELNGAVVFTEYDERARGDVLKIGDGTAYGNVALASTYAFTKLFRAGPYLYAVATTDQNTESLWRTDGTVAGTVELINLYEIDDQSLFSFKQRLYFTGTTSIGGRPSLMVSNGSAPGTYVMSGGSGWSVTSHQQIIFQGAAYQIGTSGGLTSLLKIDGGKIVRAVDVLKEPGIVYLHATDSWIYLERAKPNHAPITGGAIWRTDGTRANTVAVRAIAKADVTYSSVFASSKFLFAAARAAGDQTGDDLWLVHGNGKATFLKDINKGPLGAEIQFVASVGDFAYFTANDSEHGQELWRSDGTSAGTSIVADLRRGRGSIQINSSKVIGSGLYFMAVTSASGVASLFHTSAETGRTTRLGPTTGGIIDDESLVASADQLYFTARTPGTPWSLWKTDGTASHTEAISANLPFDASHLLSIPTRRFIFLVAGGESISELWALPL